MIRKLFLQLTLLLFVLPLAAEAQWREIDPNSRISNKLSRKCSYRLRFTPTVLGTPATFYMPMHSAGPSTPTVDRVKMTFRVTEEMIGLVHQAVSTQQATEDFLYLKHTNPDLRLLESTFEVILGSVPTPAGFGPEVGEFILTVPEGPANPLFQTIHEYDTDSSPIIAGHPSRLAVEANCSRRRR